MAPVLGLIFQSIVMVKPKPIVILLMIIRHLNISSLLMSGYRTWVA